MEERERSRGVTVTVRLDDVDDLGKVLSDLKAAIKTEDVAKEVTERQFRDVSEQIGKYLS